MVAGSGKSRAGLDYGAPARLGSEKNEAGTVIFSEYSVARIFLVTVTIVLVGCTSIGSDQTAAPAVPTDNIDNCRGGVANATGVSSLFSSGSSGVVKLGMTECELVNVLGEPSQILRGGGAVPNPLLASPDQAPVLAATQRQITLVYAREGGSATGYRFVENALKEISRM